MSPSTCEMHALGHSAVGEVWRCHGCGRFQLRLPDASLHLGADAFEELFELVVLARARSRQVPAWHAASPHDHPVSAAALADDTDTPAPSPVPSNAPWRH